MAFVTALQCQFTTIVARSRAVTFAIDERQPQFEHFIKEHARVLQFMAMYFHAHARRKPSLERTIDDVSLSPRLARSAMP